MTRVLPPADAEVLQDSDARGRGNALWLFRSPTPRLLKLYRPRRSPFVEALSEHLTQAVQGISGVRADVRMRNEQRGLALWAREGFDVVRVLDLPLPEGIDGPALWLEYVEAPLLKSVLRDPGVTWAAKAQWIERYGANLGARHERAAAKGELGLVHEHAGLIHVFARGERLVHFDLEGAFCSGTPIREALAQELSTALRSLAKSTLERFEPALDAFIAGYARRELLREAAHWGAHGRSLRRLAKRWADRRENATFGKGEVLVTLLARL
jgi:tRNA A-37 threonylcarbamoyl transferase component Bud32